MCTIVTRLKKTRRTFLNKVEEKRKYSSKYLVEGTVTGRKKMLYVLAGYKPYLWNDVFGRICAFQPEDMEVCIISSGKYCEQLSSICKRNNWVYVSTKLNNICVASNIAIRLFPKAEYIFKLDEDIYLPENYFEEMIKAYDYIESHEPCLISYICPQLPLGFYGMHSFLERMNCLDEYEGKFGKHRIGGTAVNPNFRKSGQVDCFIWEKIGNFDACAGSYFADGFSYEACITRSGIAAILFKRTFWEKIGGLKRFRGKGLGSEGDEGQITSFCALSFMPFFCVNNILVGHFAFGGAETEVLKLRQRKPEIFEFHEKDFRRGGEAVE